MSELSTSYVFCEASPTGLAVSNTRELITRAIEQLTEMLHAQGGPWSSSDQRAVAALQAALYHLEGNGV